MPENDLFGNEFIDPIPSGGNPLIPAYGPGPEGKICKNCTHFFRKQLSRVYRKCDLRKHTNGPGSDHKANWPACGKYEEVPWDEK